jgi:N-acetylmuramoyl-L-alanine amidase
MRSRGPARALALAAGLCLLGSGCASPAASPSPSSAPPEEPTTSTSLESSSTTTTPTSVPTTTTEPALDWPALPDDGVARAAVTSTGVVGAVLRTEADGRFIVRTPCGGEAVVTGTAVSGAHVVLDPGHGGDEPGAVGPAGTTEKAVNLAVAQEAQRQLEALGATVVLTRTGDHRITLASRAAIATSLGAELFISIHHNAEPDGPRDGPGSETYFQISSPESKRASGLLYEELVEALDAYDVAWVADTDAGAKHRARADGGDYYGILNRSAGVPAVLSEAAFISNPAEEALLLDPAFQAAEAGAITRAAVRFLTTSDPGSGYVEPYPRTSPAGPGGGSRGCVDPPLG